MGYCHPVFTEQASGNWGTSWDGVSKGGSLLSGLERALALMGRCGIERVYLDGSFVTDKDRPGDIDGCYDVPRGADLEAMYPIWPFTWPNRLASKARFGAEMFPSGAPATASGEPFLSFFKRTGRV